MVHDLDRKAVIVGGLRTPFAKADTDLKDLTAVDLGRIVVSELLEVYELDGPEVDAVVIGNIAQPPDSSNIARVVTLRAGLPKETPAHTVNRNCASGIEAVVHAARLISLGEARLVIAGGTEAMSRIPLFYPEEYRRVLFDAQRAKSGGARLATFSKIRPRHFKPIIGLQCGLTDPVAELNMGETAEVLVKEFGITREEQDGFALQSHLNAVAAQKSGRLDQEITPIYLPDRYEEAVRLDNGPRENQSMEALGRLRPIFDRRFGTVTAGNSCPITDGAAAVIVADESYARARGWEILGRIRSHGVWGIEPQRMGLGPVGATAIALDRAGMSMPNLELFEINEAFAGQVLACEKAFSSAEFGRSYVGRSSAVGKLPMGMLNVNGGAIALGHPVAVSGTRLILTLLLELKRRGLGVGLAALCVGGGQGAAVILERVRA
jgi:acetyl-CoA C-acetyltransferase/acetyl-CoA acyltransferase